MAIDANQPMWQFEAEDRKRKKAKIREWLKKNGRTAKQVKKKREKNDRNSRFYS